MLGQGWFSGPFVVYGFHLYGKTQSLLGKLVIRYDDGSKEIIVTDRTWKYHSGPIMSDNNYGGEDYDARYDCEG
jgi:alpha-L-rhamnosidase